MKITRLWLYALVLTVLTACSEQSSSGDRLTKELKTVASWTATARMVADEWNKGAVPTVYVNQTLEKTQTELRKELETLSKDNANQTTPQLIQKINQIEQTIKQLSTAIKQHKSSEVAQQIQQLQQQQQQLDKLAKTIGDNHG